MLEAALSGSIVVLDRLCVTDDAVDPGGECRARLKDMGQALTRVAGDRLSQSGAERAIREFGARNELRLGALSGPIASVTGVEAFVAEEDDGMGAVYCYATGSREGTVSWVRKGIGWAYRRYALEFAVVGLPLSREETMDGGAFSRFERGFIEWRSADSKVRAFLGRYPDRTNPVGKPVRI